MGQATETTAQSADWMDRANYARYLQSDRRTWAWLWLKRNPSFQAQSALREEAICSGADVAKGVFLDENLCRHF